MLGQPRKAVTRGGPKQLLLRTVLTVERIAAHPRCLGDGVEARAFEAVAQKGIEGRVQQPLTILIHRIRGGSTGLASHRFPAVQNDAHRSPACNEYNHAVLYD